MAFEIPPEIRMADAADLEAMLAIYRPYVEQTAISFEYTPPTAEEFRRRFFDHTAQFPWLVWEEHGEILGYAYAGAPWERAAYNWCAESSIYLRQDCRGRHMGTRLYAVLEEILRLQGYRTVYALVTSENQASVAFHQSIGYRQTALFPNCGYKFGRWHGVVWLEKRLQEDGHPQGFPRSWRDLELPFGKE